MTDIWDEINLDSITYESDLDPLRVRTYLEKLKANYVSIMGKAENYDILCDSPLGDKDLCYQTIHLKKKLETIKNKVAEWDSIHMRERHAAPSILSDLEKILEIEG